MTTAASLKISDKNRAAFTPILKALGAVRQALAAVPEVIAVAPGYRLARHAAPVPAVVVYVVPGTPESAIDVAALGGKFAVPIQLRDAEPEDQLTVSKTLRGGAFAGGGRSVLEAMLTRDPEAAPMAFAAPRMGSYEVMEPSQLNMVDEPMKVTICVSPEAGWSELEEFLGGVKKRLTVAMYQFTAPHIVAAVQKAVKPAHRELTLVMHPVPEKPPAKGVKANDLPEEETFAELADTLKDRFQLAWATVGKGGLWASAYHIKVAVRDGDTVWASSGNWQSSNQPCVYPFSADPKLPVGFQRKYNRDYHCIIQNRTLAGIYETYIKRDFALVSAAGGPEEEERPELFVPEEGEEPAAFGPAPKYFKPLHLDRKVRVQPLLTPDNYAKAALKLIRSAKSRVWFQNQYINFRNTGEDFQQFQELVAALKDQIDAGRDVRIICRDLMKQESVDVLLALDFPSECMRFQAACHNKTILVDDDRVMFGSHNWSNEGVLSNRDSSMIFYDAEITQYLSKVYDYDWTRLATAHPAPSRPRVAKEGEATPPGMRRTAYSERYED